MTCPIAVLTQAAEALAAALRRENAVLAALDLGAAPALFAEKSAAFAVFEAAQRDAAASGPPAEPARGALRAAAERLAHESAENRRLLEQAMTVQGRVIALVAGAVPKALNARSPKYGARGAFVTAPSAPAFALLARA